MTINDLHENPNIKKFKDGLQILNISKRLLKKLSVFDLCNICRYELIKQRSICGIYFLIRENEVVYVGQSICLYNRIKQHTDKIFNDVYYQEEKKENLISTEDYYIEGLNPVYNKKKVSMKKENTNGLLEKG